MREVVERVTCSIDGTKWIVDGTASGNDPQVVLSLSFSGETSTVTLDVCDNCRPTLADHSLAELMRLGDPKGAAKPKQRRAKSAPKVKRPRRGKEMTSAERWAHCKISDSEWQCPDPACKSIKATPQGLGRHIGAEHPNMMAA